MKFIKFFSFGKTNKLEEREKLALNFYEQVLTDLKNGNDVNFERDINILTYELYKISFQKLSKEPFDLKQLQDPTFLINNLKSMEYLNMFNSTKETLIYSTKISKLKTLLGDTNNKVVIDTLIEGMVGTITNAK